MPRGAVAETDWLLKCAVISIGWTLHPAGPQWLQTTLVLAQPGCAQSALKHYSLELKWVTYEGAGMLGVALNRM